jgi:hypothetical protein
MVAVPNIDSLNARFFGANWSHLSLPHHFHHFTNRTLRLVGQRAGLRCAQIFTESLVHSVEMELCAWLRRTFLAPRRITHALRVFYPVASFLVARAHATGRGDALVAHFKHAKRSGGSKLNLS